MDWASTMSLSFKLMSCILGVSSDELVLSACGALLSAFISGLENLGKDVTSSSESESESKTILNLSIKF